VGDWRSYNSVRSETIKGSPSDNITPSLSYQVGASGSGSYVIGSFTASASSQTFTIVPGGSSPSAQINAIQLRDVSPPNSSIWTNALGGSWAAAVNWSNGVANGVGATADFSTLTLPSGAIITLDGARSIGTLLFDDASASPHGWTINTGKGDPLTLASSTGTPVISNNVLTTIGAVLAGTGGLNKSGGGTLILSAANIYTGATTIGAGTLQLGDGIHNNGSISGNIVDDGALVVANPNAQILANTLSGSGGLTKLGPGTLTLSSSNSYQGATIIGAGTLRLLPTQLTNGLQIMPLGDSITYGSYGNDAGYRGFLYNLLNPVAAGFQFVGAAAENPGALPTAPIDETRHNGYPSYATLDLANNLNGFNQAVYLYYGGSSRNPQGGYWLTGGNGTGRGPVYPDIVLLLVGANDINQAGQINPLVTVANYPTNLTALINEIVTLRPAAKVIVADITPYFPSNANIPAMNRSVNAIAAGFQSQGKQVSVVDLNTGFPTNGWSGDGIHPNDTGYSFMASQWYYGILAACSGASYCIPDGSLVTVATNAQLDLNGARAGLCGLTGTGNILLGNGGMLTIATPTGTNTEFDGVVTGAGALIKSGAGSFVLGGANTYTGATTVSNGVLLINGSLNPASIVTVAGGTLGGTGVINGMVIVQAGGTLAPGTNGVGSLATGTNIWNAGGGLVCGVNGIGTTTSDQLLIDGALNISASAGSPFTIKLVSLTSANTPGPLSGFNKHANDTWTLATAAAGVLNFAANEFILDTSLFSNDFSGGTFSLASDGNSLMIQYVAPLSPPVWSNCALSAGNSISLSFTGPAGQSFEVMSSTNVSLPLASWTKLTGGVFGNDPAAYLDNGATNGAQFYRIISP
jgi:autotransporter-associated beta strand protein